MSEIAVRAVSPDCWADFEQLMGPRGGSGGCWCMLWRCSKKVFDAGKQAQNRTAMKEIIESGERPGVMAYDGDVPVAWCQVAPRTVFKRLEGSRVLRPVDQEPVHVISCFLIARTHRRQGISIRLIEAAMSLAADKGATIVEGYPIDPATKPYPATYAWTGLKAAFDAAGFTEVARRSPSRPIMRRRV